MRVGGVQVHPAGPLLKLPLHLCQECVTHTLLQLLGPLWSLE